MIICQNLNELFDRNGVPSTCFLKYNSLELNYFPEEARTSLLSEKLTLFIFYLLRLSWTLMVKTNKQRNTDESVKNYVADRFNLHNQTA